MSSSWLTSIFVVLGICFPISGNLSCPSKCKCSPQAITCKTYIPHALPENVSIVYINERIKQDLTNASFRHNSWQIVQKLTIQEGHNGSNDYWLINDYAFVNLKSLTHLTLNCPMLKWTNARALYGLEKLTYLNTSSSSFFDDGILNFARVLIGNKGDGYITIPNLEDLDMANMGLTSSKSFYFDENFLLGLAGKPVRMLNVSGINFGIFDVKAAERALPLLRVLNVSHAHFYNSPRAGISIKSLQVLDISGTHVTHGIHPSLTHNINRTTGNFPELLWSLREFVANDILQRPITLNIQYLNVDFTWKEKCSLRRLELKNNHLQGLNISASSDSFCLKLEVLNLCCNKMQYISRGFLSSFAKLKKLGLSENRLQTMNNYNELSELFRNNTFLEEIDLQSNGFTTLPSSIFQSNFNLQIINLSFNKLTRVDFNVGHLRRLRLLDLSNNIIKTIGANVISMLASLFTAQENYSGDTNFSFIVLSNNHIQCSCDTGEDIRFLVQNKQFFSNISCEIDSDNVLVNQDVLPRIQSQCLRPVITAVACLSLFVIIVAGSLLVYWFYQKMKQHREDARIKNLIDFYRKHPQSDHYLAFLSYCSEDDEFVFKHVHETLQQRLRDKLEIFDERTVVCIADLDFPAGHFIEDSIVKAVDSSDVVIFVISKAFCNSRWCNFEARTAYYEQKPILLMFREEVPMKELPSVFRYLFKNFVRVLWKIRDGKPVLHPRWDKVCQFIIQHHKFRIEERNQHCPTELEAFELDKLN